MANTPFIGEIQEFAGNFAPRGWAYCDGQLLAISSNTALFSIIGTIYGGDGRTTFALPDLRGRLAIHPGNGPGLSSRRLGEKSGTETNTITSANLPSHNHSGSIAIPVSSDEGDKSSPIGNYPAETSEDSYSSSTNANNAGGVVLGNTGGGQSVNNMMPYIANRYIIALQGVYPSR